MMKVKTLKALLEFASTDPHRPQIHGLLIEPARIAATDGHTAIVMREQTGVKSACVLKPEPILAAAKAKVESVELDRDTKTLSGKNFYYNDALSDLRFPYMDHVIFPSSFEFCGKEVKYGTGDLVLNAKYLERINRVLTALYNVGRKAKYVENFVAFRSQDQCVYCQHKDVFITIMSARMSTLSADYRAQIEGFSPDDFKRKD